MAGDLLIANIGGSPPGQPDDVYAAQGQVESNGTGVIAFDKLTGEVRWQATDELASYSSPITATMDGRPWAFILARGGLVGLDPRSGKVDFEFPWRSHKLESVNASGPVVVGDRVFISETYEVGSALLKVSGGEPEVIWRDQPRSRQRSMELHWNTAIYHDGYLYGSSGRHTGNAEMRCIAFDTGEVQWSQPGWGRSSMLYVDQHLISLSEDGTLRLLRATPQAVRCRQRTHATQRTGGRSAEIPGLECAGAQPRTALCPRERSLGVPGSHSGKLRSIVRRRGAEFFEVDCFEPGNRLFESFA